MSIRVQSKYWYCRTLAVFRVSQIICLIRSLCRSYYLILYQQFGLLPVPFGLLPVPFDS